MTKQQIHILDGCLIVVLDVGYVLKCPSKYNNHKVKLCLNVISLRVDIKSLQHIGTCYQVLSNIL